VCRDQEEDQKSALGMSGARDIQTTSRAALYCSHFTTMSAFIMFLSVSGPCIRCTYANAFACSVLSLLFGSKSKQ
jgi:hypothetical protein